MTLDTTGLDEALEMESNGAKAGLNPLFGEWRHHFPFAPVPYGNGRALAAFKGAVHADLAGVRFFYSSEIRLEITLFLDLQSVLETSETADLDNYAKAILDSVRGPSGIMLDDTQVQALTISWIDSHETYFTIEAASSPDDFVLKGIEFYEMPDRLWYPHGRMMWTNGEAGEISDMSFFSGLVINQMMSGAQRKARIAFRNGGFNHLKAYQGSRYFAGSSRGYHRSRVIDSGFVLHTIEDWTADLDRWRENDPERVSEIEETMKSLRDSFEAVHEAILSAG